MDFNMNDRITSYEVARRYGNDALIIQEILNENNQMAVDLPNEPCNRGELHEVLLRDTYPKAEVRGYGMGVGSGATQTRTVSEGLMMLSIYAYVEKALADATGDPNKVRMDEAVAFLMGIGHQMAELLIYANKSRASYEIDGLAARYSNLNDRHVINFGGNAASQPTSIYIVAAGSKLCHLIHNKAYGAAGVRRENKGEQQWEQHNQKPLPCYVDFYTAQFGLAIEHPDAVFRIANVPTVGMTEAQREELIDTVLHVQKLLPPMSGTACLYGNLAVEELVEKAAREKQVVVMPEKDPWGHPVNLINGMRVRRMDVIKTGAEEMVA